MREPAPGRIRARRTSRGSGLRLRRRPDHLKSAFEVFAKPSRVCYYLGASSRRSRRGVRGFREHRPRVRAPPAARATLRGSRRRDGKRERARRAQKMRRGGLGVRGRAIHGGRVPRRGRRRRRRRAPRASSAAGGSRGVPRVPPRVGRREGHVARGSGEPPARARRSRRRWRGRRGRRRRRRRAPSGTRRWSGSWLAAKTIPRRPRRGRKRRRKRAGFRRRIRSTARRRATVCRPGSRGRGRGRGPRTEIADAPRRDARARWTGATGAEWAQWFLPGIPPGTPATPLCLVCGDAYDASRRETLGHPFCGEPCAAFRVKTRAGFARAELFKLERGVCQSCGLDCDALLARLLAEPSVPERVRALESARGPAPRRRVGPSASPPARAAAIARAPRAGDLWQADHIVPVAEGGGECGLENFRTLCDGCHRRATSDLRARMRLAAAAAAAEGTKRHQGLLRRRRILTRAARRDTRYAHVQL